MTKKLAVIGSGTAGALTAAYFNRWEDWEIDWYYDPNISSWPVGEGATLTLVRHINTSLGFTHYDLPKVDGTFKSGVFKTGWGNGSEFFHAFQGTDVAYHFNAKALQKYILDKLSLSPKINVIEKNVSADDVDADYVFDCRGVPKNFDDYHISDCVPVNSAYVTQCYWDHPKFQYSLMLANKYRWVFGIPLRNRCSIGYLYNDSLNTLEEVKQDVQHIFSDYELTPSDTTLSLKFKNYYSKAPFDGRIYKNGTAAFFLEPLEAASVGMISHNCITARNYWNGQEITVDDVNNWFIGRIKEIENMIMIHYYAGSQFDTPFWKYAQGRARKNIQSTFLTNPRFSALFPYANKFTHGDGHQGEYGTWGIPNWKVHFDQFNVWKDFPWQNIPMAN